MTIMSPTLQNYQLMQKYAAGEVPGSQIGNRLLRNIEPSATHGKVLKAICIILLALLVPAAAAHSGSSDR